MSLPLRSCPVYGVLLGLLASGQAHAVGPDPYRFEEGEPLAYKTQVSVLIDTTKESKYFEHFGKAKGETNLTFNIDYQLLPIAHDDLWKVRLVLDQVTRTTDRGGEVETATFDRSRLQRQQISVGNMLNLDVWNLGLGVQEKDEDEPDQSDTSKNEAVLPPRPAKPEKVRVPEDLFDRPILTWFSSDGTLKRFEDRSEIEEIMDGLDLKECIKLLMPPLPPEELTPGFTWTREEDVDLPELPLKGQKYEPLKRRVAYTVKSVERVGESMCAHITVRGRFARAGLWIPIAQEKRKYLIWTTFITNLEDRIDGELVYDLEQRVMRASTVKNAYNYFTVDARKEDNYRGQVLYETSVQTQITSALVEPAQANPVINTAFNEPQQTIEQQK